MTTMKTLSRQPHVALPCPSTLAPPPSSDTLSAVEVSVDGKEREPWTPNWRLSSDVDWCETVCDDDTITHYVAGDGPPLILLHGLGGSAHWWAPQFDYLARHFRVYALDLVGFGRSRGPSGFALKCMPARIVTWMNQMGLRRAHVAGHSLGGFVATELAADYPDRVDRLLLVSAAVPPLVTTFLGQVGAIAVSMRPGPGGILRLTVSDALRCGPLTIWRASQQLLAADLTPKLARVRAETLLVWGSRDRIVPVSVGRRLASALPRGRLEVMTDVTHAPHWERPHEFAQLVTDFLCDDEASVPSPGRAAWKEEKRDGLVTASPPRLC